MVNARRDLFSGMNSESAVKPRDEMREILSGVRVVLFALNLPGPAAAARLARMGATVVKIEPLAGDPFEQISPAWYSQMCEGIDVRRMDLREPVARASMDEMLGQADVFITSFRHQSLVRLSLDPESVSARFPNLCQVSITGFPGDQQHVAGHDLTYQASAGLLDPHSMPRALIADLGGVERAVSSVMMLLFARTRSRERVSLHVEVALADVASDFAIARKMDVTTSTALLGGANPYYRIYECREGFVALAALEPHFQRNLLNQMGREELNDVQLGGVPPHRYSSNDTVLLQTLTTEFQTRTAVEWERWGETNDVPLTALVL